MASQLQVNISYKLIITAPAGRNVHATADRLCMIVDKQAPVSHQHRASQRVSWSQGSALLPGSGPEGGKVAKSKMASEQWQGHSHCRGVV